jgi:hypothetical protein
VKHLEPYLSAGLVVVNIVVALLVFLYAKRELTKEADRKLQNFIADAKESLLPAFREFILEEGLPDFVEWSHSDEGSVLIASFIDPIVDGLKKRIYGELGGLVSGNVRGEKAIEKAVATDLIEGAHPLAPAILDRLPSVKKLLTDNPALLAAVPSVIQKYQGFIPLVTQGQKTTNGSQNIRGL